MDNEPIKSKVEPLAKVLSERKFFMPRHQRPYDWKPEHVNSLLDDLLLAVKKGRSHHFLGTIMLVPYSKKNKWGVSDGQQRITTFLLICANLCRLFHESGDTAGENKTLHMLFDIDQFHSNTFEDAQKMRLHLRVEPLTHDRTNFEMLITGNSVKRNGKLVSAWKVISKFFLKPEFQNKNMRQKFLDFLLTKIFVARIDFQNATDSINVFETQNTRGKSLEQIQLACTYFHMCLEDDEKSSERLYQQIERVRTVLQGDEDKFFNYARCLALCRYGHLSSDHFYHDIKNRISEDADEVRDFGKELSEEYRMGIFRMLVRTNRHDGYFEELSKAAGHTRRRPRTISDYVQDLRNYRSVSNAILFSLFCKYYENSENSDAQKRKKIAKFVCISGKFLSSFFQRAAHSFPGSFIPSHYEAGVSDLAMKIAKGQCKTPADFLDCLKTMDDGDLIIPDAQYKKRMREISFSKGGRGGGAVAKYILSRINEHLDNNQVAVPDVKNTIEHILPKSDFYADNWDFNMEEHGLYVHRLGNLTILSDSDNKPDKEINKSFKEKRKLYRRSSYQVTKQICDFEKWNGENIEKRQKELAEYAAFIWNLKLET